MGIVETIKNWFGLGRKDTPKPNQEQIEDLGIQLISDRQIVGAALERVAERQAQREGSAISQEEMELSPRLQQIDLLLEAHSNEHGIELDPVKLATYSLEIAGIEMNKGKLVDMGAVTELLTALATDDQAKQLEAVAKLNQAIGQAQTVEEIAANSEENPELRLEGRVSKSQVQELRDAVAGLEGNKSMERVVENAKELIASIDVPSRLAKNEAEPAAEVVANNDKAFEVEADKPQPAPQVIEADPAGMAVNNNEHFKEEEQGAGMSA